MRLFGKKPVELDRHGNVKGTKTKGGLKLGDCKRAPKRGKIVSKGEWEDIPASELPPGLDDLTPEQADALAAGYRINSF